MLDNKNPYDLESSDPDDELNSKSGPESLNSETSGDIREIKTNSLAGPLILFVGPRESGKTTVLINLTKFLKRKLGFKIDVNRTYRSDSQYKRSSDLFLDQINNNQYAPKRNANVDFLAVTAFKGSEQVCQFLEAPGEAYFIASDPHSTTFPPYILQTLTLSNTNKTLIIFFEEGMLLKSDPAAYSRRLSTMIQKLDSKIDDVIILFNKVDKCPHLYKGNKPNLKSVKNLVTGDPNYTDFFNTLKEMKLMTQFVAYSSGDFQKLETQKEIWTTSPDFYSEDLWRAIDHSITPHFIGGKKILK
jgi:hypothetical protein